MLKPPKSLQNPTHLQLLSTAQQRLNRPLYEGSALEVPHVHASEGLLKVLRGTRRAGHLVGGFEKIQRQLGNDQSGFESLAQRGQDNTPQGAVRIVLLCNEGSLRFYRNAEKVLGHFSPWVSLLRLDMAPEQAASSFFGKEGTVKALLIDHKDWTLRFFESWLEEFRTNS